MVFQATFAVLVRPACRVGAGGRCTAAARAASIGGLDASFGGVVGKRAPLRYPADARKTRNSAVTLLRVICARFPCVVVPARGVDAGEHWCPRGWWRGISCVRGNFGGIHRLGHLGCAVVGTAGSRDWCDWRGGCGLVGRQRRHCQPHYRCARAWAVSAAAGAAGLGSSQA